VTQQMAIRCMEDFIYGRAPRPVELGRGVTVGGGDVVPEINFTLPPMQIRRESLPAIERQYREMIRAVLARASDLHVEQLLVEFETLPEMTVHPEWGLAIVSLLAGEMERLEAAHGVRTALRFTPNDVRESIRPPMMRRGKYWEALRESLAQAGEAGADAIAIESTGGKEVSDKALLRGDLRQIAFALGVLGARDMAFLWDEIVAACDRQGLIPSGDTACGFANTAMVLADRRMLPKVLAAVVRVATVPRSLVAIAAGAVGPSKDCAYEGPYLKAIAGIPISMEGRSAACAHLSPVGNVAMAVCDAWSNESVQNVKLLSGMAPVMSLEQLVYDVRLLDEATRRGEARRLRDWLAASDAGWDPQAYVLHPDVVLRISAEIARATSPYDRTLVAIDAALREIQAGVDNGGVRIDERERTWLERLRREAEALPESEGDLIDEMLGIPAVCALFRREEYGL